MPKVTMVGAGSAVFARQIITDVLAVDGLDSGTFALVDIDAKRLELARAIAQRLVELSGKKWKVEASTDRTEVLAGTDYVVNSIEVAGLQNVRADYDIPMKYGVDQCIGDTIGPGGIFKAPRAEGDDPQLHQPDVDPHACRGAVDVAARGRPVPQRAGHVAAAC